MEINKQNRIFKRGEKIDPYRQNKIRILSQQVPKIKQRHIAEEVQVDRHTVLRYSSVGSSDDVERASMEDASTGISMSYVFLSFGMVTIICIFALLGFLLKDGTFVCLFHNISMPTISLPTFMKMARDFVFFFFPSSTFVVPA